jgi:hypothetical protein
MTATSVILIYLQTTMSFKCSAIWQLISTFDVVYNLIYIIKLLILDLALILFIIT